MKYRILGKTKLYVSEIAFGSWGIGGYVPGLRAYGPKSDVLSCLALEEAYQQGVTLYDTANSYGFGHSERLIGETLRSHRANIVIASKGGYLNTFPDDGVNQRFDIPWMMQSLTESLFRLQTNYIDIYQLHSPSWEHIANNDGLFAFLEIAKNAGLIRYVGFAAKSPDDALRAITSNIYPFDVIQVNFNLTDQRALDNGLFQIASEAGIGILARSPLVHGFLTGSVNSNKEMHSSDHRLRFTDETTKRWHSALDIYDNVFIKEYSSAQNAIRFCLSFPNVGSVITGMNTHEQVSENTRASECRHLTIGEIDIVRHKYHDYFAQHPIKMLHEK